MRKLTTFKLFQVYLAVVLSYFVYAAATGTRIMGDDKEEFEPNGGATGGGSTGYRGRSYYHK